MLRRVEKWIYTLVMVSKKDMTGEDAAIGGGYYRRRM
jgi:hypothetical protein